MRIRNMVGEDIGGMLLDLRSISNYLQEEADQVEQSG